MSEAQRDLNRSRTVLVHTLQRIAQTGVRQSDRQNVHDLMLNLDPLLDDHQGGNAARSEQRRRGEPEPAPQGFVPVPRATHTLALTTDDLAWLLAQGEYVSAAVLRDTAQQTAAQRASLAGHLCEQCLDAPAVQLQPAPWGARWACVWPVARQREGQTRMAESGRCARVREGQRWLQAVVEAALAQVSIPLASGAMNQPAVYWETQASARPTLYLWLAEEAAPRQVPFGRAMIEDCGAGSRPRQAYARFYILRSLRQMGLLSS